MCAGDRQEDRREGGGPGKLRPLPARCAAVKLTPVLNQDYSRRYLENMKNANHRLVEQVRSVCSCDAWSAFMMSGLSSRVMRCAQAGKQVARVQKFLEQVQEKRK